MSCASACRSTQVIRTGRLAAGSPSLSESSFKMSGDEIFTGIDLAGDVDNDRRSLPTIMAETKRTNVGNDVKHKLQNITYRLRNPEGI